MVVREVFLIGIAVMLSLGSFSQEAKTCGQDEHREFVRLNPYSKFLNNQSRNTDSISGLVNIPVVVHVLYASASQNIPDSRVYSQIDVLNEDFQKLNPDTVNIRTEFIGDLGNPNVSFCLARIDPQGNPTTGITRTSTTRTSFTSFSNDMMLDSRGGHNPWPTDKYLNIWVCVVVNSQGQGQTGFAVFPWDASPAYDGIVVNYAQFGDNNGDNLYGDGRIGTHEVGHFLGLSHNFKGGCSGGNQFNCNIAGDSICDTPPQRAFIQGCQPGMESCGGVLAQYENFMDYGIAGCRLMFTNDQSAKVRATINKYSFRKSITTNQVCLPLGIEENQVLQGVEIYPNPVSDLLQVNLKKQGSYTIEIFDFTGKLLKIRESKSLNNTINLSNLESGVYILMITDAQGANAYFKVIKN